MTNPRQQAIAWMILGAGFTGACTIHEDSDPTPPPPVETRTFRGDVFDGVTGAHLTAYDIAVDYFGRYERGTVDARGGFHLPTIPALHDFSVYIDAPGYRPYVAHNAQWTDVVHGDRSFYFLAYLFSNSAQVADVPFTITLTNSAELPSGSLRLRPTSLSNLYDEAIEQPGGVPGQVWQNDNDLLSKVVFVDFKDGAAVVPGASLGYGVPYQVSVFNVPGYQILQNTTFQAGMDRRVALQLNRLSVPALDASYVSTQSGNPSPDGTVTIVLNQAAEFDPLQQPTEVKNALDRNFSIVSPDTDADGMRNVLFPVLPDPTVQSRATSITIDGQAIVLKWDRTKGLIASDAEDRIDSVTYAGLAGIRLRPLGGNASDVVSLDKIVGSTQIAVTLVP
ncbi:MAG TPA: hypothetical protein VJT73_18635 [Polyangiaceae bacterium]|nr:hypothetical protein [Polyangiaceae bacterium]